MLENLEKLNLEKINLNKVPTSNGIYVFWDKKELPLYIGKSKNLRIRLQSYLLAKLTGKSKKLIELSQSFSYIKVASDLESLLLEANLVKKFQPKFNIQLKDDKNPLYIKITKEDYPRVLAVRKEEEDSIYFGPFPSSTNVKSVLWLLRKIFPFSQHKVGKKPCLYSQIELCDPCPSKIEKVRNSSKKNELKKRYKSNVRMIKTILSGKVKVVRLNLEKDMRRLAKEEKFEEALLQRKKIEKLDYVTQPINPVTFYLKNPNFLADIRNQEIINLKKIISKYIKSNCQRIESYDVSHISGSYPTASMVTFINGDADKAFYRHFKIKQKMGKSDTDSLREVIKRRIKHFSSWGMPDLIVVDGGKPQVSVFFKELNNFNVPVVGLAKREDLLVIPVVKNSYSINFITFRLKSGQARNLLHRMRDEAHRFARSYHTKLVKIKLFRNF